MIGFYSAVPEGHTPINFFCGLTLQEALRRITLIPRKPDNLLVPYFVKDEALRFLKDIDWVDDYSNLTRSIILLRRLLTVRTEWSRK